MGFCVASTKNGSASRCRVPPAVIWYSCIASSRADCVLGGVRLISSARITLPKIGPLEKLESPAAGELVLLDDFRAGDVGRHQVGRELDAAELQGQGVGQGADHQRLGQARHAHQQAVPAGEHGDQQFFDDLPLADDHAAQLLGDQPVGLVEFLDGLDVVVLEHRGAWGSEKLNTRKSEMGLEIRNNTKQ